MKVNKNSIEAAGRAAGKATDQKVRIIEQPSTRAASINSYGNASLMNRQINTLSRDQYSTAPSFHTGAGSIQQRSGDGAFTRFNEDGTFAYDTSQGISNLGFAISASSCISPK